MCTLSNIWIKRYYYFTSNEHYFSYCGLPQDSNDHTNNRLFIRSCCKFWILQLSARIMALSIHDTLIYSPIVSHTKELLCSGSINPYFYTLWYTSERNRANKCTSNKLTSMNKKEIWKIKKWDNNKIITRNEAMPALVFHIPLYKWSYAGPCISHSTI